MSKSSQLRLMMALTATVLATGVGKNEPERDEPPEPDEDDGPQPPRYRKMLGEPGPHPRRIRHDLCPACNRRVSEEARTCSRCGENLR